MTQAAPASADHASDGAAYEIFLGRWTARLAEGLLDFAAFPPSGDLLEAGCGTGSLALAMARRWPVGRASLTIRMDYASFDDDWQPLLGGQGPVGTYAQALAPALRDRVEAAVRAAYLAGAPDGQRSLTATAWAVRAPVP
jgi:hypothetical protein